MASSGMSWGIELGSGAIKAVKLAASDDGVEIVEYAHVPHPKVLSTPDLDADDAMRVALGQFAATRDLGKATVGIGIPGHESFARFAKLPPVEPKKVPEIVKFEAIQQIPFSLEQVEWDYQTFASDDSPEIEVGIFAVTKERVNRQLSLLRDVGIVPDTVVLNPVAAYNAVSYDLGFTEETPGTVILDVGTKATDLIVADQGRVWVRTFPLGGHHFTEALVNAFKLSYSKADKLKREAEKSKHARHVFQAMKGVFADLAQETQRSIGYYQSLHPEAELTRVIGIGSTFKLPGLRRFLKQQLQTEVYRVEEFKRVRSEGPLPTELLELSVEMMPAYGLALQGLGLNTIQANLMPVSVLRESVWRRKVKWMGIAAGLSVGTSAAMFLGYLSDTTQQPTEPPIIRQVSSQLSELKRQAEEAGVTSGGADAATATELLNLGRVRNPYPRLIRDASELMASANGRVSSWQADRGSGSGAGSGAGPLEAFAFEDLQLTYLPGSGGGDGGGGGRGGPRGGFGQPAGGSGAYAAFDRVEVVLRVSTAQPDARDFVLATVRPWLVANAKRDGVEYTLVEMEPELDFTDVSSGSAGVGGARRNTGGGFRSLPSTGRGFGDEREGEGGGGRFVGGGRALRPGQGGGPTVGEARVMSLEEIAPLPENLARSGGAQEGASTFEIRWTAAYLPEEAASDEQAPDENTGGRR